MTAQARQLGGRYQVGELLGYGGMAEVHKGRDLRLGRDVAIKMLRTDLARDATFQERFRREAQNAAALNHPAIVAVYDTGEEISATGEKQPFIVMEFVNGLTLKEVLAAEQRLQPRRALEIIADICAALEFSHRHGIIHRDIKPGNVMLTQNGQVKVMDFGIARALASGATTMTQTSAVIGTAQYLSPEQARGEAVDARSDVYAAGCVLFELLIGHPPFVGDSPVSVAYQHVREEPRTPSDVNPEIPPDLDAIVLKALAKNPLNRYQSAQEMRADALRAVAGRPVMATPVMNEAETMAMTGGPPRSTANGGRPVTATMVPHQPERTSSWVMATLAALGVLAAIALGVGLYLVNQKDDPAGNDTPTPTTVAMPQLVGKSPQDAKELLKQMGFTAIIQGPSDKSEKCTEGEISKQSPQAGDNVPLTQTGNYQICTGPGKVPVPENLVGGPYENAKGTLEGLGFDVDQQKRDSIAPKNQVLELNPGPGTLVEPKSKIIVIVSAGNRAKVPNVVGETRASAEAILKTAGFDPEFRGGGQVEPDDPVIVDGQSPKAGNTADFGDKVTVTLTVPRKATPTTPPTTPTTDPGTGDPSSPAPPPGNDGTGGGDNGGGDGSGTGGGEDPGNESGPIGDIVG